MTFFHALTGSLLLALLLANCREEVSVSSEIERQDLTEGVTIESINHLGISWQVITVDPEKSKPSIRHSDSAGKPLRDFSAFDRIAQEAGETSIWMMNAGMYHQDGSPVGLCIANGNEISPLNPSEGEGNFFLMPNGIFLIDEMGPQIIATKEWNPKLTSTTHCATQSGPLLVRRGVLHPAIRQGSPNKFIRNGVGLRADGHLCFVISANQVSFHDIALFFRDHLDCPDALYLDGAVSALFAPKAGLNSQAKRLGPVLGLWE